MEMFASLLPMMLPMSIWDSIMGFFATLAWPLFWAVSGLLTFFHYVWAMPFGADSGWTWTLSIVSLTIVVRAALIPLFVKQIQSSRNMQLIQPEVRELQKKYAGDRERLGQETMKLYRERNANPMASCLPLLLQMPIFLTLFQVLDRASRGQAAGFWLEQNPALATSLRDATLLGAQISDRFWPPWESEPATIVLTVVLILAMTGTMFYTQLQLTRKNMPPEALEGPMAQQQKMMLYLFPVIFAVGGMNFPIGVLLYWLTSNLWTMAQQVYIIKRNPAPGTPAYAEWEAKQINKGKDPKGDLARERARNPVARGAKDSVSDTSTGAGRNGAAGASKAGANGHGANGRAVNGSGDDDGSDDAPRIVRQQRRRQPRSQRGGQRSGTVSRRP